MASGADLVALAARACAHKPYVYAAHPAPSVDDPAAFDCSGLVGWVCGRVGISLGPWPPYTVTQWMACKAAGTAISIDHAIGLPGALLFNHRTPDGTPVDPTGVLPADYHAHVAFSRGDGFTVEAMNAALGCGVAHAQPALTRWTAAALVPGITYVGAAPAATHPAPAPSSSPGDASAPAPATPSAALVPAFPGEAFPGAAPAVVRAWQVALIACRVIADTDANRDGDFGPGMTAAVTRLQASFGWSPDGRGGRHTWAHLYTRPDPPCPRCGG
jgi:hypothetical protein